MPNRTPRPRRPSFVGLLAVVGLVVGLVVGAGASPVAPRRAQHLRPVLAAAHDDGTTGSCSDLEQAVEDFWEPVEHVEIGIEEPTPTDASRLSTYFVPHLQDVVERLGALRERWDEGVGAD